MISELGEIEARALLQRGTLGRLGVCEPIPPFNLNDEHHRPYVVPVSYWYDDNSVYVHSLTGRKIRALRANPHGCLQVDEIESPYAWRSVMASGLYEEVTDAAERDRILSELFKRLPHLTPVESRMSYGLDETIVFRLRLTSVTGIFEK
jgi:uncharacterized protein